MKFLTFGALSTFQCLLLNIYGLATGITFQSKQAVAEKTATRAAVRVARQASREARERLAAAARASQPALRAVAEADKALAALEGTRHSLSIQQLFAGVFGLILSFMSMILCLSMFFDQLPLILHNETACEYSENDYFKKEAKRLKKKFKYPYDSGRRRNLQEVFGKHVALNILLPCKFTPVATGVDYPPVYNELV